MGYLAGSGCLPDDLWLRLAAFGLTDAQPDLQGNCNLKPFIPTVHVKEKGADSDLITVRKGFGLLERHQIAIERG